MEPLPLELFLEILSYFSIEELCNLRLVCCAWDSLIARSELCDTLCWRPFVLKRNPKERIEEQTYIGGNTWYERLKEFANVDTMKLERILEVAKGASDVDLKKAYRRKALRYYPRRGETSSPESERGFKEVSEAYEILSDPKKRAIYDTYGVQGVERALHQIWNQDLFTNCFDSRFLPSSSQPRQTAEGQTTPECTVS